MNKHTRTDAEQQPHVARPRHPHHPAGLLYTILRHGRGLSVEEALRLSMEPVPSPPLAA